MTYEDQLVRFAEEVLSDLDTERAWYQTPPGHMRTVCTPRFQYSTCLRLLRDAKHGGIDIGEVVRRHTAKYEAFVQDPHREERATDGR